MIFHMADAQKQLLFEAEGGGVSLFPLLSSLFSSINDKYLSTMSFNPNSAQDWAPVTGKKLKTPLYVVFITQSACVLIAVQRTAKARNAGKSTAQITALAKATGKASTEKKCEL
jgi:hypothetical protein